MVSAALRNGKPRLFISAHDFAALQKQFAGLLDPDPAKLAAAQARMARVQARTAFPAAHTNHNDSQPIVEHHLPSNDHGV